MDNLNDLIRKYKNDLLKKKANYKKKVSDLPKGTLTVKRNKNTGTEYFYLKYREGKKIVSKYLGKISDSVHEIQKQIVLRKKLEKSLKEMEKELKLIKKIESL